MQPVREFAGESEGTMIHRPVVIFGLAFCALSCAACIGDGYLGMTGFVHEAVSATAHGDGRLLIDTEGRSATTDILKPIADCDITLEPWTPAERPDAETARLWTSRATSEANGFFTVGKTATPGSYDATVSVTCPGFIPVRRVFRHNRFMHEATITMVRAK
jgi:hypothetical protein